jgi:O-antigen ligase
MIQNEISLPSTQTRVNTLTVVLGLTFFGLVFYLRNTMTDFGQPFILVFTGLFLVSFISGRVEAFILLLLVVTSTVFELMEFPTIPIMIGDLFLSDVMIMVLLLGRLLKRVTVNVTLIPRPLGYPVLAFILAGIFSFLYATWGFHVSTMTAGVELRAITHMSLFFLVYYYVRTDRQLRSLLLGIGIIAGIVALLLMLQYVLGSGTSIVAGRVEMLATDNSKFNGVTRVLVPGSSIMLFALNTVIAIYLLKGLKHGRFPLILMGVILTFGMVLTFTRVFWVMILVAVIMLLFIARRRAIIYPRMVMLLACGGLAVMVTLQAKVLNPKVIEQAVISRSLSILRAPRNFQHDTLFMRFLESRYALDKIEQNPLLGIGLGKAYRPIIFGNVEYESSMGGTFLHNGYLATQLKMGVPGTVAFLWLIGCFFWRVRKKWKLIKTPLYQAVVLGIAVSVAGMMIHNLMASPFLTVYWVSVLGVGFGITEKIYQFEGIAR